MILHLALFILVALSLGLFGVNLLWPREDLSRSSWGLRLSISVGIGMGLLSLLMFFWLLAAGRWLSAFNGVMWFCLVLGVVGIFFKRSPAMPPPAPRTENRDFEQIARIYFLLSVLLALIAFVFYFLKNPHGNWDAWSHWNLRARFIYWGGDKWANALHPDYWNPLNYPLLIPMVISAGWGFVSAESHWIPGLTAMVFALGSALLLTFTLARSRGKTQGYLAGIVLLGTPFFLTHGISQYSDIPLAFYFLASLAMIVCHDQETSGSPRFLVLAGILAGFAAWTKNEGLLFIICFFTARLGLTLWRGGWRRACSELLWMSAGLLPVFAVDLYVKTQLYAPRTIFETRGVLYNFHNFSNLERYRKIVSAYWNTFFGFGKWKLSLSLLLIFYGFWLGPSESRGAKSAGSTALWTVFLMLCGYFVVYLSTPHNIDWLIGTSIDRLFLCLWPSFLLGYFLVIRSPEEAVRNPAPTQA